MDTITATISPQYLLSRLGSAQQPLILDVRRKQAFDQDPRMIAGAVWRDPFTVGDWLKFLPRHRDIAVYCVHGHEISRNAAAALTAGGLHAVVLEGGIESWTAGGAPTIHKQPSLGIPSAVNAPSTWVTRERPKIDRIACPWLVRRFIDPLAEFRYVPAGEVIDYAAQHRAIAYDVPAVQFSHRGDLCSFDALLADFQLNDPLLRDLATIVRGADTAHLELSPQSPGLLAVSLGLSALYADDLEMLRHGMTVYDALYAWLRSARAEVHNAKLFQAA